MPSVFTRILLFLSSYFPLTVIFFVLLFTKNHAAAIIVLSIGLVGLIGIRLYLHIARRLNPMNVKIASLQRRDAEAMSYIVSYIIPFLAIPFQGLAESVSLGVFFFVLGVLYVNSNLIHINPMLNLSGYRLYEITLENGAVHSLITRRVIVRGDVVKAVKAGEGILLEATP